MAEKKKARIQIVSPKGTFRFPKLTEPDYGTKDYPNPDGAYSTGLVYKEGSPEAEKMIALLKPHYDEALAAAEAAFNELPVGTRKKLKKVDPNPLYEVLYDKETEEPTGDICFKTKMKASGEVKKGPKAGKKWSRKPTIFDAKGQRMVNPPEIWGGTIGKVSFEPTPYFVTGTAKAGLRLNLEAVQIIELVEAGGARTAEAYGFGEEDGYSYQERVEFAAQAAAEDGEDEDDGAGDF